MNQTSDDNYDRVENFRVRSRSWYARSIGRPEQGSAVGVLAAFAGGLVTARLFGTWLWHHGDVALNVIAIMGAVFGFVVGGLLGVLLARGAAFDWRQRLVLLLMVSAWFFGGFLFPAKWGSETREAHAVARQEAVQQAKWQASDERSIWLADVEAAHAHGPPGEIPPLLKVEEHDDAVWVTNVSGQDLSCVRISRAKDTQHLDVCRMGIYSNDRSGTQCRTLRVGATTPFVLYKMADPECFPAPLAFEIGSVDQPEPSWWSDNVLQKWRDDMHVDTP